MRGSAAILLDASHSSWPDFVDWLFEFRLATEEGGLFAYLRPPRDHESETRRVVRELAMSDFLQVIAAEAPVPDDCVGWAVINRLAASASCTSPRPAEVLALAG